MSESTSPGTSKAYVGLSGMISETISELYLSEQDWIELYIFEWLMSETKKE